MRDATEACTDLVLDVFRVNGLLLAAGEDLARAEGLTSARWQVLGAIALVGEPLPVPRIARQMGLTRQSVQASVTRLVDDGMLTVRSNEGHARSPLFDLSERGAAAYERLVAARHEWIGRLTAGATVAELDAASGTLRSLATRIRSDAGAPDHSDDEDRRAFA